MATYFSPTGNPEVWAEKPENYYTTDEWHKLHPPEEIIVEPEINPEPTLSKRIDTIENIVLGILKGEINV